MLPTLSIIPYIIGVILIFIVIYVIVYVIYPSSGSNDMLPTMTPLNKKKHVVHSDVAKKMILGSSGSTVMGFFKLQSGDRSIKIQTEFIPLLYIADNWYLEISITPVNTISARFKVQSNKLSTSYNKLTTVTNRDYEIIDLPPIPKQKWVFIAILRDGRRFDIIYDNKIVASHRLKNYPVVIINPLSIGETRLDGSAIHIIINNKRLSPNDVERERITHVDTNNMVLEDNQINMTLPGLHLFAQCPPGLPCDPITRPPNNKLVKWDTPYH